MKTEMENEARPCERALPEQRCAECNRLLFCGYAQEMEIKCPKCKSVYFFKNLMRMRIKNNCKENLRRNGEA